MDTLSAHTYQQSQLANFFACLSECCHELEQNYDKSQALADAYKQEAIAYKQEAIAYKQEAIDYKQKAHYWEKQFSFSKDREAKLQAELAEVKAQLAQRNHQLFGKKSESGKGTGSQTNPSQNTKSSTRKRGQQPDNPGPGRRKHDNLPVVEETVDLAEDDKYCPCCKLPYEALEGTEDSEVLELTEVKAYKRAIRRKRYQRQCSCEDNPAKNIVLAPAGERVFPKARYGVTIWARLLLDKYAYHLPTYRSLAQLSQSGLSLAAGTVADGFRRLTDHLMPVYNAMVAHNKTADHWHADETTWRIFAKVEGKLSQRWYVWVFRTEECIIYKLSPSRSAAVLDEHFGEEKDQGIVSADRYSAYKTIASKGVFVIAYCWAHVRRDFLDHAKGYPHQEAWALQWVEAIANLYHINNQRITHQPGSAQFEEHDQALRKATSDMKETWQQQLTDANLLPSARARLVSLQEHWAGLIIFVEHPQIPMDNNPAERSIRPCKIGLKNYNGHHALWSGQLGMVMFTLIATLKLWNINVHTWLLSYLSECAVSGGQAPDNVDKFLPWNMTDDDKARFSQPPVGLDSS